MSEILFAIRTSTFKKICLAHSKFPTTIEALLAVCFLNLLFEQTPHHYAAFVNISALKCGVYSKVALIRGRRLIE